MGLNETGVMEMTKTYCSSPPSSRLPPDGHEFPSNYEELIYSSSSSGRNFLPRTFSLGNNWQRNSRNDERSERSVRDKIALFTKDPPPSSAASSAASSAEDDHFSYSMDNLTKSASTLPRMPQRTEKKSVHVIRDVKSSSLPASAQPKSAPNVSKLRGLVIPAQSRSHPPASGRNQILHDLPEIISKNSVIHQANKVAFNLSGAGRNAVRNPAQSRVDAWDVPQASRKPLLSSLPWKSNSLLVPKYSPAFKRKELTLMRSSSSSSSSSMSSIAPLPPLPPAISRVTSTSTSRMIFDVVDAGIQHHGDDFTASDTDSAVSSGRSSFTPSGSPVPFLTKDLPKSVVDDVNSVNSVNRILKAQSVEAQNRKNVLHSARCSSGGLNGRSFPSYSLLFFLLIV